MKNPGWAGEPGRDFFNAGETFLKSVAPVAVVIVMTSVTIVSPLTVM